MTPATLSPGGGRAVCVLCANRAEKKNWDWKANERDFDRVEGSEREYSVLGCAWAAWALR